MSSLCKCQVALPLVAISLLVAAGCSQGGTVPAQQAGAASAPLSQTPQAGSSILKMLKKKVVIGSTIDPALHQLNPYGLTVAPATLGDFTAGDLVVCNFNDKKNVQGTGHTLVALHPTPGSKPTLVSEAKQLGGCDALALTPGDITFAAAFAANDNPFLSDSGKVLGTIKGTPFDDPFGEAYAQPTSGNPSFYESNAGDGTIVRINLGTKFSYDVIATGFAINHGKPGSILGPSGLSYNSADDTLYIVDGTNNTVVAFSNVSTIPSGGITVEKGGKTFKGPNAADAHLIFAGTPLDGPISSALLFNGNLVVGNTLNPSGQNIMVELSPSGQVLDTRNVDTGAAGALFGIVATGTTARNTKVYFNDDNANNVQALER